jgi:hypothetical protein
MLTRANFKVIIETWWSAVLQPRAACHHAMAGHAVEPLLVTSAASTAQHAVNPPSALDCNALRPHQLLER